MTTHLLTAADWAEIAALPVIREAWGLAANEGADCLSERTYGARFDFASGGPGYVVDLVILQGDALNGNPPFLLVRDPSTGRLVVVLDLIEY